MKSFKDLFYELRQDLSEFALEELRRGSQRYLDMNIVNKVNDLVFAKMPKEIDHIIVLSCPHDENAIELLKAYKVHLRAAGTLETLHLGLMFKMALQLGGAVNEILWEAAEIIRQEKKEEEKQKEMQEWK